MVPDIYYKITFKHTYAETVALADVAQLVKHQPMQPEIASLILCQGPCLGCGLNPQ